MRFFIATSFSAALFVSSVANAAPLVDPGAITHSADNPNALSGPVLDAVLGDCGGRPSVDDVTVNGANCPPTCPSGTLTTECVSSPDTNIKEKLPETFDDPGQSGVYDTKLGSEPLPIAPLDPIIYLHAFIDKLRDEWPHGQRWIYNGDKTSVPADLQAA